MLVNETSEPKEHLDINFEISTKKLSEKLQHLLPRDIISNSISYIGLIITLIVAVFTSKINDNANIQSGYEVFLVIAIFTSIGFFIRLIYRYLKQKDIGEFCQELAKDIYKSEKYTAIFILKHDQKILVYTQSGGWDCFFLPFTNYEKTVPIDEQLDNLKKKISLKLELSNPDFELQYLEKANKASVKADFDSKSDISLHHYAFFTLNIKNKRDIKKLTKSDNLNLNNINYHWKFIEDLRKDGYTMMRNEDVISHINDVIDFDNKTNSFVEFESDLPSDISIIWNIATECPYHCDFCATDNQRNKKISFEDKAKMLLSIGTLKNMIYSLDFAGGDPLYDGEYSKDNKNIINYAHTIFDEKQIFISTTGISVLNLKEKNDFFDKNKNIELTYDLPQNLKDNSRDDEYNFNNFKAIEWLNNNACNVNVNFALSERNSDPQIFSKLLDELEAMNLKTVTMIRLQPVGKAKGYTYEKYNYEECIAKYKQLKGYGSKYKLHCSFRVIIDESRCNMLTEKIGLDAFGNVFACPWASNYDCNNLTENPFYLGNLLEYNLIDILTKNKKVSTFRDEYCDKACCPLAIKSYNPNKKSNNFEKTDDPIYIKSAPVKVYKNL